MNINDYCKSSGLSKDRLTDDQIIEFGRLFADNTPLYRVFQLGTDKDKKDAVTWLRKAIKDNKRLLCTYLINEDPDNPDPETKFAFALD